METYVTRQQAAEYFQYHPNTITHICNEMRAKGIAGVTGKGRGVRISLEKITWYLERREHDY